ncbi:hypothetical protein VNO77_16592 [Canavalia gladiata]|uniref:Nucleotide-diphospho-sugar transferase domain-containing protein n=1 Tax=Canavalia gladiata TaxID=3824 RepID=A0AAN9QLU7_CANGL
MRPSGLRNSLNFRLTAFLILLLCFLLYHFSGSAEKGVRNLILFKPRSTHLSQNQELIQVLRRASMSDRTVILTMVDESSASPGSILDILLESFKSGEGTKRLLNHLVIVSIDPQAFEYCRSLHPHCIHPSTFPHSFALKRQSSASPDHNVFTWTRNDVLLQVIQLGYNIIFTDADVLWLRSPLINFNPVYELTISCNFLSDGQQGGYLHDGGIFFLKANAIAFEFLKYWKLTKIVYPGSPAVESFCTTIMERQDIVDAYGFRVKHVNATYFGGFCQINKDILKEAYAIHANCCEDLTSKVHDLRIVLNDWIHFRKRVSGDNASDKMALRWPQKCSKGKYTSKESHKRDSKRGEKKQKLLQDFRESRVEQKLDAQMNK